MKDYTSVFYMICEGNVPSIQCKPSLDRLQSMGNTDGLTLIFIYFHVPALTHRPHRSEAALKLPDNNSFPCNLSHGDTPHRQRELGGLLKHKKVKGKVVPVLNYALHHKSVLGSGRIALRIL
jgi:hypothetical protein